MATKPTHLGHLSAVSCSTVVACTFNTSNIATGDETTSDDAAPPLELVDSGAQLPDASSPQDCPNDIRFEITVDGVSAPLGTGQPYVHTLVGDSVELSAVGSCTQSGQMDYRWTIEPSTAKIEQTARPKDLASETISVYSLIPEQYTVKLEIDDGIGPQEVSVFGFEAHGFQEVDNYDGDRVRDIRVGYDYIWLGAEDRAYRGTLDAPLGTYKRVTALYGGSSLPNKVRVHEVDAGGEVWFGPTDPDGEAYRLDLVAGEIASFNTISNARAKDITDGAARVRFATDKGVALTADSEIFTTERTDHSDALSDGATGVWAGRDRLYPLPTGADIDLFPRPGGERIQSLDDDGVLLWIGTDGDGVATFENGSIQLYDEDNGNLADDDVECLAIDADGDVRVATATGVGRFKSDRQICVPMTDDSGLDSALDLDAIAADDTNGRRAIYVGGRDGLFVMRTP
ncbi:MAG: hypothetical protein GY811_02040 [Myxococcales bacterium]|nr:hypothetical protein [Myxococcales bacterium]